MLLHSTRFDCEWRAFLLASEYNSGWLKLNLRRRRRKINSRTIDNWTDINQIKCYWKIATIFHSFKWMLSIKIEWIGIKKNRIIYSCKIVLDLCKLTLFYNFLQLSIIFCLIRLSFASISPEIRTRSCTYRLWRQDMFCFAVQQPIDLSPDWKLHSY